MKLKRLLRAEMYGLRGWFGRTIIASAAISVLIFCALHWGVNAFLAQRYASSRLIEKELSRLSLTFRTISRSMTSAPTT